MGPGRPDVVKPKLVYVQDQFSTPVQSRVAGFASDPRAGTCGLPVRVLRRDGRQRRTATTAASATPMNPIWRSLRAV